MLEASVNKVSTKSNLHASTLSDKNLLTPHLFPYVLMVMGVSQI